jgi:LmbE family N-acetylglucosaminyl deacetylase
MRCLNLEAAVGQESAVRDAMDGLVSRVRPDTVYAPTTHDEAGEVRTLHAAVRDSARSATRVLAYQALRPTVGFSPSTFVDVTRHLDDKLELLECCAQNAIGAVAPDVARATATYWGRFGPSDQAEPLEVLRMAD